MARFRQRLNICIKGQFKINKEFFKCISCKNIPVEPENMNIDLEMCPLLFYVSFYISPSTLLPRALFEA